MASESQNSKPAPYLTKTEIMILVASVLVVGVAAYAGYTWPNTGTSLLKDLMVFLGGVGVAVVLAQASARTSATERVRSLCRRSVQRLGLTTKQAMTAAAALRELAHESRWEAGQAVAMMLDQLAEQAEVSMGDLEEMAGVTIGLDPRVADSLGGVAHDAREAAKRVSAGSDPELARRALEEIGTRLGQLEAESKRLKVGTLGGVTAKKIQQTMRCPSCSMRFSVTSGVADGPIVARNCFGCKHRLRIDLTSGDVSDDGPAEVMDATFRIVGRSAQLFCPKCGLDIRAKPREDLLVSCARCTTLIQGHAA